MSKLLYQLDSYLKEFECQIIEVYEEENAVVLDQTAFYPSGGGQPCDIGVLQGEFEYIVNSVKKKSNKVYHYIQGVLPKIDEKCKGIIDWDRRYKLMRTHTAMHFFVELYLEIIRHR